MKIADFQKTVLCSWRHYFEQLPQVLKSCSFPEHYIPGYPTIARFTRTESHLIFELLGCASSYQGLSVTKNKCSSLSTYFSQFDYEPDLNAAAARFGPESKICVPSERQRCLPGWDNVLVAIRYPPEIARRCPVHRGIVQLFIGGEGENITQPLYINPEAEFYVVNNSCLYISHGSATRNKSILHCMAVRKNVRKSRLQDVLRSMLDASRDDNIPLGVHAVGRQMKTETIVADQFANMFLTPMIAETAITSYIEMHPAILLAALKHNEVIPQIALEWYENGKAQRESGIKPDFFLKRVDGYCDICDFKLPRSEKEKLTKGPKRRRGFLAYIQEAISQLAYYRAYFDNNENAMHAFKSHGIKVNDPYLIVVVGTYENFDMTEMSEAYRSVDKKVVLLDYDTLYSRYIGQFFPKDTALGLFDNFVGPTVTPECS